MRHLGLWAAFALSAVIALVPGLAVADDKSCAEFRENIIRMESESVRPPGWYSLDRYLRLSYVADCIKNPTAQRPSEADIASACAGSSNPSMCAMMTGVTRSCASPTNAQERYMCWLLLGDDPGPPPPPIPASADLPPLSVTVDGQTYALPRPCERALNALSNGLAGDPSRAAVLEAHRQGMEEFCHDLLAALERRLGTNAQGNPSAFWPALEQLALSGFAPRGAAPTSLGSIHADPGFQRMCREANANMNTCAQRQNNMRSIGTEPTGTLGQAGAFNSCRILYGQVLAMCDPKNHAAFTAPRAVQPPPKPAAPPQAAKPPADGTAKSSAPPQAASSGMSEKCQKLVSNYVAASQANDGPGAVAGYNALKQAGGCNVLAQVDKPMPAAGAPSADDPRFAARPGTALSDRVIGGCDAAPDVCAARVQQLRAGVSPEAVAALWMHAINVGLELGGAMANAAAIGAQRAPTVSGSNTNMNSIGNRPVRSTSGQGSATGSGQQQFNQGCVDCRTGTAR